MRGKILWCSLLLAGLGMSGIAFGQEGSSQALASEEVKVHKDDKGFQIRVNGRPFMIRGMNWGYIPIGENYAYDFWNKPDAFIEKVLDGEMGLLQEMGVNAIRQYDDIPPRWVAYIHKKFHHGLKA